MNNIINVKKLSFTFSNQNEILKDLDFAVEKGDFLAIAGPNGAGKTTLLNLLCAVLKPKAGSIEIDAKPIQAYSAKALAQKIAVVRQEFIPVFDFSVEQVVSMGRSPYLGAFGLENENDKELVRDALNATDTTKFAERSLANLSAGERQRVFIARAIAQDTPVLLLDEPTSFLDLKHQVKIYDLLKKMQNEKNKTIISVTHDINLAAQYCENVLLIAADAGYLYGSTKQVFSTQKIEQFFSVKTYVHKIGSENIFIPLGLLAKDRDRIDSQAEKDL